MTPVPIGDFDQVGPDDLNNSGQATGVLYRAGGGLESQHGFVWSATGGVTDLGAGVFPQSISERGAVVGVTAGQAFIWTPAQGVRLLSSLPGGAAWARASASDINASGQVLGVSTDPEYRAFVYNPNGTVRVLPLPATSDGLPLEYVETDSLTEAGDAVGMIRFSNGGDYTFHGAVWPAAGGVRLLDDVPGGPNWSGAGMMNIRGQIVGQGQGEAGQRALLWAPDGRVTDLGDLPGKVISGTAGINDAGEVIGWSQDGTDSSSSRGFLWTESEGMIDLNNLLDGSGAGWTLTSGQAINNSGQILVAGFFDGRYRAALLTPLLPEPAAVSLFAVAAAAMLRRRHRVN